MNKFLWFSVILLGFVHVQDVAGQSCPADQCQYFNSTPDSVKIGIIANMHQASEDGKQCSQIIKRNVEMAAAIQWIFGQLNSRNFIPGVTLETVLLDACSREDVALHELVSVFPNFKSSSCQQKVHGVVGLTTSTQSQTLAESLGSVNIPIISPYSSASSLSNSTKYPSFFRTIPSVPKEVEVLFSIVQQLGIQYVSLVYSEDAYGQEGIRLLEMLFKGSVCVGGKFPVTDNDIIFKLIRLQGNLPDANQNLPVVYLGGYPGAKRLVAEASKDSLEQGSARFLWIFSSGIAVDTLAENTKIARNTLSVIPHLFEVQEFTGYWPEELERYLQSKVPLPHQQYYQEYIDDLYSCPSNLACLDLGLNNFNEKYQQTNYLNYALDAGYVYANAFKVAHKNLCGGLNGLCTAMQQALTSAGYLTDLIREMEFTYDANTFPFIPTYLSNTTIRFNGSDLANPNPYIVKSAQCDQTTTTCNFIQVGSTTGNQFLLRKQDVQFYLSPTTSEPTRGELLPPLYCQRNCETCLKDISEELPFASIWGDFIIASFFTATEKGTTAFGCSDEVLITESVDVLETMLYAVDVFNGALNHSGVFMNGRPPISGKLGMIAFNDCRNPLYATQLLSNWLTKKIRLHDDAGRFYDPEKCVAVIGGSYSSINLPLLSITKAENLLQVSATATSVQLEFNGSFLRTIPADDVQVQVMVDFVKKLESKAVSVVYQDDPYGVQGYEELKAKALEAELCISEAVKIPVNIQEKDVHDVLDKLRLGRPTRIVILFTVFREALTILKVANTRSNKKEFVWIGTESWGKRQLMLSDDTDPEALGSFTILVPTESSDSFAKYLATRDPERNARNPFFRSWWEKYHNCQLPTKTTSNPTNRCPVGLSLQNYQEDLHADLVRKAVWSIGIGLSSTIDKLCRSSRQFCDALRTPKGLQELVKALRTPDGLQELVKNVKQVEMEVFGEKRRLYTERGDGNVDEDVLNVKLRGNNRVYEHVAKLDRNLGFNITGQYTFYDENRIPVPVPFSTCNTCNCIFKHKDDPLVHLSRHIHKEGDMYIAAILPIHASTTSYNISLDGIVALEALLSTIEYTNTQLKQRLGLIIFDGYGSRDLCDWHIVSLINSGKYLGLEQYNINDSKIIAFLTKSDQNSLTSGKTITDNEIVHFDLGKSLSVESDNEDFYFSLGYSIPSEMSAMIEFLIHHRWIKVQLLCSKTTDSAEVCELVRKLFEQKRICATMDQTLDKSGYQTAADNVLREAAESETNVVVALIEETDVAPFMDALGATGAEHYPVFIGWSRFTKGVSQLSGTYKDVCNNSVGFLESFGQLSDVAEQVRNTMKSVEENPERNPWLTANLVDFIKSNNLTSQYAVIEDTVEAANILASAMNDLWAAECQPQRGLCDKLLSLTDWRKRLLTTVNERFKPMFREKSTFDIVIYATGDTPNAPYHINKIGFYDVTNNTASFTSKYILNNVTSECMENQCDVCKRNEASDEFSAWGIAFLFFVPLLMIIIAILLACIVLEYRRKRREKKETYQSPDSISPREHWRPPPLPSRESQTRVSHGVSSIYNPGASEVSTSSYLSGSSLHSDNSNNRGSASTLGVPPFPSTSSMPRQSSGNSLQNGNHKGVVLSHPAGQMDESHGSYLNRAFSQPEELNKTEYSMSLDNMPPQTIPDQPIRYSQLQFENPDPYDKIPNAGNVTNRTSSNNPAVTEPVTDNSSVGMVSSV